MESTLSRVEPQTKKQTQNRLFLILIGAFLLFRLSTLLTSATHTIDSDEYYQGYVAHEILQGLRASIWDYQVDDYTGGSVAVGVLAAPLFKAFGATIFSLKLLPLFFSFLSFVTMLLFVRKFFNEEAALITGALILLAPPTFISLSLMALGSHADSLFLGTLALFFFYRFLYVKTRRKLSLFFYAFFLGLASWYANSNLLILMTSIFVWWIVDRRTLLSRVMLIFVGGLLLGLTPWFLFNASHHFSGFNFLMTIMEPKFEEPLLLRFRHGAGEFLRLWGYTAPTSLLFPGFFGVPSKVFSYAYYLLVIALVIPFLYQAWRRLDSKVLYFLIAPIIYTVIYCFGRYRVVLYDPPTEYFFHYLMPIYWITFPVLGLALAGHRFRNGLLVIFLCFGVLGQSKMQFREAFGVGLQLAGFRIEEADRLWRTAPEAFPKNPEQMKEIIEILPQDRLRIFYRRLSHDDTFWRSFEPQAIIKILEVLPDTTRAYFYYKYGESFNPELTTDQDAEIAFTLPLIPRENLNDFYFGLAQGTEWDSPEMLEEAVRYIQSQPSEFRHWFAFALGKYAYDWFRNEGYPLSEEPAYLARVHDKLPDLKSWIYRGMGVQVYVTNPVRFYNNVQKNVEPFLDYVSIRDAQEILWGIGWAFQEYALGNKEKLLGAMEGALKDDKQKALQGFDACEVKWFRI